MLGDHDRHSTPVGRVVAPLDEAAPNQLVDHRRRRAAGDVEAGGEVAHAHWAVRPGERPQCPHLGPRDAERPEVSVGVDADPAGHRSHQIGDLRTDLGPIHDAPGNTKGM